MANRVSIIYNGFEVSVLPILEFGAPLTNPKYSYFAYICRSRDAESKEAERKYRFSHPLPDFLNEAAAVDAGLQRGKSIVDGKDVVHSVEHL
ncbi:hypothetical protein [Collimonas humicola]|uniref:hypothetical protein n=1 Tax=Collimonas humicola TaxID=2825886 RepID=UPI001B8B45D7|nr:hypothetical protein [Collimonas humicola]